MAFVPVPNTVMVEAVFELGGQVIENTYYFEAGPAMTPNETTITELLTQIRTTIQTDLLPTLTTAIALVRLVGTLLTAVESLSVTLNVSPPATGGVGTDPLPSNVAYCVTFLTSARGRSFRGRNYVAGFGDGQFTGNIITSGVRTALLAFYTELLAATEALGWSMVVVSRFTAGAPRVTGVTTPITGFTTFDTVADSQRRRLPGRGR